MLSICKWIEIAGARRKSKRNIELFSLIFLAIILQLLFLICMRPEYHAISMAHGNVAYNLYRYNMPAINSTLAQTMYALQKNEPQLLDFYAVKNNNFGPPDTPFPVNDTIGYGVLLGLLWKITHSLSFNDVVMLQFFLYLMMLILLWHGAQWLFCDTRIAWYTSVAFLTYLPLVALNLHAVRDVWAAYGVMLLLFALVGYLNNHMSTWSLFLCCIGISICLWIRPSLFLAVIVATGIVALKAVVQCVHMRKACIAITLLWLITTIGFWIPLMYYNAITYNRLLVSPVGQDVLEGLGEYDNPWGHKLSDEYVAHYIGAKYGLQYGTPAFDDAARAEFNKAYQERPLLFWKNMLRRIPSLLLPALPWIFYAQSPYASGNTKVQKIQQIMRSPRLWLDALLRYGFMWWYVLLGYIGCFLLYRHKRYDVLLIIIAILCASWAKLPSHIEYRYLTPYYWVLCLSIGYLIAVTRKQFFRKKEYEDMECSKTKRSCSIAVVNGNNDK